VLNLTGVDYGPVAVGRRLAAIMFTDLEGYTALAQADEAAALRSIDAQEKLIRPLLGAHRGRKIKSIGDGLLIEFPNARDAIEYAVDLQRAAYEFQSHRDGPRLRIRVGIHLGDVEQRGQDILGDAVNIASRLEPLADAGGICLSVQVYDQVRNKVPFQFQKLGPKNLKGIQGSIEVYRVVLPWSMEDSPRQSEAQMRRLAVLPFVNFSPDPADAFFADGLTEELIATLSQLQEIRVIARTSVFQYKSTPKPVSVIGKELSVGSVLEGSVRKARDQVRITVQLIDVDSEEHRWAATYDRDMDDVFAIQSEVCRQVADALKVKLGPVELNRIEERPAVNPESYLAYLKGRALLLSSWAEEPFRQAKEQFDRAIALDPTNARAFAGAARARRNLARGWDPDTQETRATIQAFTDRALELGPNLAEVHLLRSGITSDWSESERELKIALSIDPSFAEAHWYYASFFAAHGLIEEMLREYGLAEQLDPLSILIQIQHVAVLSQLRRSEEARKLADNIGRLAPDSPNHHTALAWSAYAVGDYPRSLDEWAKVGPNDHRPWQSWVPIWSYALMGEREKARGMLERVRRGKRDPGVEWSDAAEFTVMAYALLGEYDEAFRIMNEAVERGDLSVDQLRCEMGLESFRKDPRFQTVLKRMSLA